MDRLISEQAQADGEYISKTELLKAIDTWDRFGVDDTNSLFRLDNLSLPHYVAYIHYDDVVKCIKGMPSVAIPSAEPKTGQKPAHWTVDFTCSNCGCKCYPMDIDFGNYNYCPNCGREMEEGD